MVPSLSRFHSIMVPSFSRFLSHVFPLSHSFAFSRFLPHAFLPSHGSCLKRVTPNTFPTHASSYPHIINFSHTVLCRVSGQIRDLHCRAPVAISLTCRALLSIPLSAPLLSGHRKSSLPKLVAPSCRPPAYPFSPPCRPLLSATCISSLSSLSPPLVGPPGTEVRTGECRSFSSARRPAPHGRHAKPPYGAGHRRSAR